MLVFDAGTVTYHFCDERAHKKSSAFSNCSRYGRDGGGASHKTAAYSIHRVLPARGGGCLVCVFFTFNRYFYPSTRCVGCPPWETYISIFDTSTRRLFPSAKVALWSHIRRNLAHPAEIMTCTGVVENLQHTLWYYGGLY